MYTIATVGSIHAVADITDTVIQTYRTDEFGVPILTQGVLEQPFQYTGEQRDEHTRLVYLRARMYEPGTGRFVQRDRLAGLPADPGSLQRYAYAECDPINGSDPSGLGSEDVGDGIKLCTPLGFCIEVPITWPSWARGESKDNRPTKAECSKAIKLLTAYERIARDLGKKLSRDRIKSLDKKRDAGTITSDDLPGDISNEMPARFRGKTLAQVRKECANAR